MTHYLTVDINDNIILDNLKSECKFCMENCSSKGKLKEDCKIYDHKRRIGIIKNTRGTTFMCCGKAKTTKLFQNKLEILAYAYHDLVLPKKNIEIESKFVEQKRVNRLVHNLTSINAHNIQEIYDIVPQEILTSNLSKQLKHIEKKIKKKPKKAALMFLRIAKHNIHMKSEFSIYKKLDRSNPTLDIRRHPIRKVLLNVLHTFFIDFSDKNVNVIVNEYTGNIKFDYETIQVAFYHFLDNAAKYTKPNSEFSISFIDEKDELKVVYKMTSLHIEDDELDKIYTEGYSGKNANRTQKNGEGIGLWRIAQMFNLNKAQLEIERGKEIENVMGFDFSFNKFIMTFKKY